METKPPQPPASTTLLRRVIDLDTVLSLHLYTFFHPILPFFILKTLEISGDGRLFFPIALSLLATTTTTGDLTTILLVNLLIGSLLDIFLIGLLKHLIRRPRPVYNKNMFLSFAVDHWSFPSGHSSRVSFIATMFHLYSNQVKQVLMTCFNLEAESLLLEYFAVVVGIWAIVTSASRVLLGRHFVLDVTVGACLGVVEGLFVFHIFNYDNLSSIFR